MLKKLSCTLFLLFSCGSLHGQARQSISAAKGTISVQQIDGDLLYGKYVLLLDGRDLFHDEGVISSVGFSYPTLMSDFIVISQSVGGSICPQHLRIIDLTGPAPRVGNDIGQCLADNPKYAMVTNRLTIKDGNSDESRMRMEYVTYTPLRCRP